MSEAKPLFFLHIPKTGGVSLRTLISYNFWPEEIGHVPDHHSANAVLAGEMADRYRFVHGHFSNLFVEPVLPRIELLTFLRDPVARIHSLYAFLRRNQPENMADEETRHRVELAHRLPFEEFIEVKDPIVLGMIENGQCTTLGACTDPSDQTLDRAQALLARSTYFGLCERFDESVDLLCETMGWPPNPAPPRLNFAGPEKKRAAADQRVRAILRDKNFADHQLYEYACALFDERRRSLKPAAHRWQRRRREVNRYRGRQTAAGQVIDVGQPILASGWFNLEGTETQRPWRFAGPGTESTLHCAVEPQPDAELWAAFNLPFFAPGLSARDIRVTLNGQACRMGHFSVAQGAVIWLRGAPGQLESHGLQRFAFDSHAVDIDAEALQKQMRDDRPIRFALAEALVMQFSPEVHPRFAVRLQRVFDELASPVDGAALGRCALDWAAHLARRSLRQPLLSQRVPWCTPPYQHHRLALLEGGLSVQVSSSGKQCLQELVDADPSFMAEILFFLFPHLEPALPAPAAHPPS